MGMGAEVENAPPLSPMGPTACASREGSPASILTNVENLSRIIESFAVAA